MISPEGLPVPALLDAAALDNREAAVFPDGRASLTELSALSTSYARALVSLGAGPGDHVGALLPAGLYAGRPVAGMEARMVDPPTGADLPDHTPASSSSAACPGSRATTQRIADELAAGSVTEAPRLSRPAAQAESA